MMVVLFIYTNINTFLGSRTYKYASVIKKSQIRYYLYVLPTRSL